MRNISIVAVPSISSGSRLRCLLLTNIYTSWYGLTSPLRQDVDQRDCGTSTRIKAMCPSTPPMFNGFDCSSFFLEKPPNESPVYLCHALHNFSSQRPISVPCVAGEAVCLSELELVESDLDMPKKKFDRTACAFVGFDFDYENPPRHEASAITSAPLSLFFPSCSRCS